MLTSVLLAWALAAPADSILLRVLTLNDFHGTFEPRTYPWSGGRPIGGIAAVKGLMDSLAAECACPTLRLDAGDQMQGSLASNLVAGRSAVEALSLLGLDAAAIGNHDLDWGRDSLAARMGEARYPWLAANVFDSATGRRPAWARPWALVERNGLRIAVVGYLTPESKTIIMDRHVEGLRFGAGRAAIDDAVAEARAAKPDYTMLVAHEGARCDSAGCSGAILRLLREFDAGTFDLVVAGHTHTLINTVDRGTPVVSARSNGSHVGVVDLVRRADGSREWRIAVDTVWTDRIRPDPAEVALVGRYRPRVEAIAGRIIATLGDSLTSGRGEFPLGNLIADAQRNAVQADVGLMNNGGIRRSLLPGELKYSDLFELQPFGNVVLAVAVTGTQLTEVLEHALMDGEPDYHVAGVTVRYDPAGKPGHRIREIRKNDGGLIEPEGHYRLAVSDFLAGGGGGLAMLRPLERLAVGPVDIDALIVWIEQQRQPLRAPAGRRWIPVTE